MFSDRSSWSLTPNALSSLLEAKKANGASILDLTESNPTQAGFRYNTKEILAALAQPQSMVYEPSPRGLWKARRAVSDYYEEQGETIDPDSLFLTSGTSEAYTMLFKLLANPGDEVLIPQPGYPLLTYLAELESLHYIYYPLRYHQLSGWSIDLDVLEAVITPKTKVVVLVHPNMPTGSYIKHRELAELDRICSKHNLALIVDEVFSDFSWGEAPDRVKTMVNHSETLTLVLNGLSKILGLPQVKLAWIVVSGNPDLCESARDRLEMITDLYLSVGTPVQHGAGLLLRQRQAMQEQMLSRVADNSQFLKEQFARVANAGVLHGEGGWSAVVKIEDHLSDEQRALQLLEQENTVVHPGYFHECDQEGFLVVSLLTPVEAFREGVSRIVSRFVRS
jgi:aspartate/methionine/tyrosine aminotransferase